MKANWIWIGIFLVQTALLHAQSNHKLLRNGDGLYKKGSYNDAETAYRMAEAQKPSVKSKYNLGNSTFQQNRYDEAAKSYEDAATAAGTDSEKASAYYNLGNAYFKSEKYKESIQAYKKSLAYDPEDMATKQNLAMARRALQQNQQSQSQNQQQKQDDQKDNQEKNQSDNQQDNNNNQQNQDNPQNQDNQDQSSGDSHQQDKNQDKGNAEMTKEEAKKLLDIMDEEEKKIQQNMRRTGDRTPPKKNW
ncbi:MAG: tetratricopeptide repeat protein [Chitinophagales bacterium]|nr:tetratricopeptide repeat protein [Chitinophagales bacterium]